MPALSNAMENALVDTLLRGQTLTLQGKTLTWSAAPSLYVALFTADPTDTGSLANEVSGGSYARVAVVCSLANWSGTQSAGSTTASSGTNGTVSNNGAITFPAPTANWGVVTHAALMDSSSGAGTMVAFGALSAAKTINNGDPAPSFPAAALQFQIDN